MDMDQSEKFVKISSDDEEGDLVDEEGWSLRKIVMMLSLCLVYSISFAAFSLISPFFPNVARDKGVSSSVVGLIFAVYPLVGGACSPVCITFIVKWGPRSVILAGLVLGGTSQVLFGLVDKLEDKGFFICASIILRAVNGLTGAACETAVLSTAIHEFPKHTSIVVGVLECCVGIGALTSPAFGGILYAAGGFPLPLIVMASVMLSMFPVIYLTLPQHEANVMLSCCLRLLLKTNVALFACLMVTSCSFSVDSYTLQDFGRVIGTFPIFVTAMCLLVCTMCEVYIAPILSLHVEKVFGMNAINTGLLFLFVCAIYSIFTPFVGWFGDRTHNYRLMLITGFAGITVGLLLIGPAPFLDFILPTRSVGLLLTALGVLGLSVAVTYVPVVPDMLQSAKNYELPDDGKTASAVAGILNTMENFGSLVGSLLAGSLNQGLGFRWATTIAAFLAAFQGILLAIFTYCEPQPCFRLSDQTDAEHKGLKHSYQALTTSE